MTASKSQAGERKWQGAYHFLGGRKAAQSKQPGGLPEGSRGLRRVGRADTPGKRSERDDPAGVAETLAHEGFLHPSGVQELPVLPGGIAR
jgi:hypothetical protein